MPPIYPYNLIALPPHGINNPMQSVRELDDRLNSALTIIDGLREAPYSMPADLKQALDNIRFHVIGGLTFVDAYIRRGGTWRQPASDIGPEVQLCIDNLVLSVSQARQIWDPWIKMSHMTWQQTDGPLPTLPLAGFSGYGGYGDTLTDVAKPLTITDYIAIGGVAVLSILLVRAMK